MEKRRIFDEEENRKIFIACNTIRAIMTVSLSVAGISNPNNDNIMDITSRISKGSPIDLLIQKREWEELFLNEFWLSVLEGAQNLNVLNNGNCKEHLITISSFFPKETENNIKILFL